MSLGTLDRAYLSKDAYNDRSREASATNAKDKEVMIGGRAYEVFAYVSKPSGYQATAYRELPDGEVVIANRGTEFNLLSPQFMHDVVRADGGMVAKAANVQAQDAIAFAGQVVAKVKGNAESEGYPAPLITAVGHSLGGTDAQIQAHHLGIRAETFNAYGAAELAIMQGPPKPGAHAVNHMDAADFVSAAARQYSEVRVYATEADLAHLRRQDYGMAPYRPEVPALSSPTTDIARWFTQSDPVGAALSGHGIGAHGIATMAPDHLGSPTVLTQDNRRRYEENRALVDAYRNDIRELRQGISAHASRWPAAADAAGWGAQQAAGVMEATGHVLSAMQVVREAPIRIGLAATERAQELARDARDLIPPPKSSSGLLFTPADHARPLDTETIQDSTRHFLRDAPHSPKAPREPLTYLDPAHPVHPLYSELRNKLPADVSNEKVAELTLAAREGGVRPGRVESVHVHDGKAWVLGTIPGFDGMVNLRAPAPSLVETMQRAEAFEHQHQAQVAQWHEQRQAQSHGRSM